MLKYEEKLHFDQHYQKLQTAAAQGGMWHKVGALVLTAVCYAPLYYAAKYLLVTYGDLPLWRHTAGWFWAGAVPFGTTDALYFACGFVFCCWGAARLGNASAQNHGSKQRAAEPTTLLTGGLYAKVRHPMYGAFVLLQGGFLLSLRSLAGLLLAVAVIAGQYLNAVWEERRTLVPQFGDAYTTYQGKVKYLLFTPGEAALLLPAVLLSVAGLFF